MSSGISSEFDLVRSGEQGVLTRPDSIEVEIEMRAFMKRVVIVGVCTMLSCFSVACGKNKSKVDTDRHYVIGTESECSVSTFDEVLYYDGVYGCWDSATICGCSYRGERTDVFRSLL